MIPIVRVSLASVFGLAAFASIRLTVADSIFLEDYPEAVTRAISMQASAPSSAFEERLAELDPAHERESMMRALKANPRSSAAWISLGLLDSGSEPDLLEAARVDRQYLPAWTLANYYFRQGDPPSFWTWAARAVALSDGEFQPLLRLCDAMEPDPVRMLAHFQNPDKLLRAYLDFLVGEKRLNAAQVVGRRMASDRSNDSRVIALADRQLQAGSALAALELWKLSSQNSPNLLTNGDLARPPLNLGFDWRINQAQGMEAHWKPGEMLFQLSGSQPEAAMLMEQILWLIPGRFILHFEALSDADARGIHWSLDTFEGREINASPQWREGAFELPASSQGLAHLRLFYRRERGTIVTRGSIQIRHLRLDKLN